MLGLFYGYLVLRTNSLLPAMSVHSRGNALVGSIYGYRNRAASIEIQALYGLVFTFGFLPSILMTGWVHDSG